MSPFKIAVFICLLGLVAANKQQKKSAQKQPQLMNRHSGSQKHGGDGHYWSPEDDCRCSCEHLPPHRNPHHYNPHPHPFKRHSGNGGRGMRHGGFNGDDDDDFGGYRHQRGGCKKAQPRANMEPMNVEVDADFERDRVNDEFGFIGVTDRNLRLQDTSAKHKSGLSASHKKPSVETSFSMNDSDEFHDSNDVLSEKSLFAGERDREVESERGSLKAKIGSVMDKDDEDQRS